MASINAPRTARQTLLDFLAMRQTTRLLQIDFPNFKLPPETLLVVNRLNATESLSRDFVYTLQLLTDRPDFPLQQLLGVMVTVSLTRENGTIRHFNGYVFSFRFVRNDGGFCFYEMILRPWIAFLRHRSNCCLFNGLDVRSQADTIFKQYQLGEWEASDLGDDARMIDACQFEETDYNYVHRRFELRGWHYRYSHRKDGHRLHLSGESFVAPGIDGDGTARWRGSKSGVQSCGITAFSTSRSVGSTSYHVSSFDFKTCSRGLINRFGASQTEHLPDMDVYEYAGAYAYRDRDEGASFARLRMQELDALAEQFYGEGDDDRFEAGKTFQLDDPTRELGFGAKLADRKFLITEVIHVASNNFEVASAEGKARVADYKNTFTCVDREKVWRPGRGFNSTETRINGIQTATVVGLPNEEMFTDEHGRVLVEFHWGRMGDHARQTAWLRVASGWAGPGYGLFFLPRTGDEVIVQWQGGNPDRPMITGRVFNGMNVTPRFNNRGQLPAQRYLSGLKSKEVKGGGYNQLRLDDTPRQLSAQLMSSHAQSQLNLGYLTHPRGDGFSVPRGSGIELATNDSVSIRAAKGLLISAWERLDASGNQLSCDEHVALMQVCVDLFRTLGQAAAENQAMPTSTPGHEELRAALDAMNQSPPKPGVAATAPGAIALGAPEGISFTTPKAIVNFAGSNLDSAASHNIQFAAGKGFVVNAGEGVSVFARQNGVRQIAHYGKFVMQSQHDEMTLNAAKDLTLTSTDGVIKLMAKELHLVAEDGSFIKIGGGVVAGSNSGMQFKAPAFDFNDAATMHATLPFFAGEGKAPPHWIALHYIDPETSENIAGAEYEIHMEGAPTITGILDSNGKARHDNVPDKPVAKVVYKARPSKDEKLVDPLDFLLGSEL